MPNARARLAPTISMISAPTAARMIWVSTTAGVRGGVPRRRGRNASTAPRSAASGSRFAASQTSSIVSGRSSVAAVSGFGGGRWGHLRRGKSHACAEQPQAEEQRCQTAHWDSASPSAIFCFILAMNRAASSGW